MGFFSSRPRIARTGAPGDAHRVEPEWHGPPRGVLGGYAATRAVIFRAESAVLVASRFDAYRTGVEFTLELQLRDPGIDFMEVPWELHRRQNDPSADLPDAFMRLGVAFADGSGWSNFDAPASTGWASFPNPPTQPDGPLLVGRGGGGGDGVWHMNQWLWPLPPDGPLTFIAQWPAFDVEETSVVVDAGELRRAADRSEVLWST